MCLLPALFMIRDCSFLGSVTSDKDKVAYVDEWEIIAPQKLTMLKERIKDKFTEVCEFVSVTYMCMCGGFVGVILRRIITGVFRKDTSNYSGCYSCRLACVRCYVFLLKIPHVIYK